MKVRVLIHALGLADIQGGKLGGNFYHVFRLVTELAKQPGLDLYLLVDSEAAAKFSEVICPTRLRVNHRGYGSGIIGNELFSWFVSHAKDYDLYYRPIGQLPFSPFQGVGISGVADINFHDLNWSGLKRWYKEVTYRYSFLRSDAVFTISDFTRTRVEHAFGVPRSRSVTVHHGAESHLNGAPKSPLSHLSERGFWLSFGHRSNKNLELALASFDAYKISGGGGRLVVLGENAYSRGVLVTSSWMTSIDVLAYVDDTELAWLYSHAAGLLFTSKYEGFGLPLLEAMRCGCPVLASDIEVHCEVAGDNAAILLPLTSPMPWADSMVRLETDPSHRERHIKTGFIRVAYFTWEKAALKSADYFAEIYRHHCGVVV